MCSAILLAHLYHLYSIFSVQSQPRLRPRFKNKLVRLWLPPFVLLWLFATVMLFKANALLSSLPWSLALVPSYLFSLALCAWLVLAKPLYGLVCAMLTVPWILAQIAAGLWLDGQTHALPLAVTLLPFWFFSAAVLCWHQAMPYMWDGSLPTLTIIHWPCGPPLKAAFQHVVRQVKKRALPDLDVTPQYQDDSDDDAPGEGGQHKESVLQGPNGTPESTSAPSVLHEDDEITGNNAETAREMETAYAARSFEDPVVLQHDHIENNNTVVDTKDDVVHIEEPEARREMWDGMKSTEYTETRRNSGDWDHHQGAVEDQVRGQW